MKKDKSRLSYVIPVFNSAKTISSCIEAIKKASPEAEIIVVNNNSTDKSRDLAVATGVLVVDELRQGRSYARNTGWRMARGDIIAFVDSDCVIDKDWGNSLFELFDNPMVLGVQGQVLPDGVGWLNRFRYRLNALNSQQSFIHLSSVSPYFPTINSSACIYRKSALVRTGGFNTSLNYLEDSDLSIRVAELGGILASTRFAKSKVYWNDGLFKYLKRSWCIGISHQVFLNLHPHIDQKTIVQRNKMFLRDAWFNFKKEKKVFWMLALLLRFLQLLALRSFVVEKIEPPKRSLPERNVGDFIIASDVTLVLCNELLLSYNLCSREVKTTEDNELSSWILERRIPKEGRYLKHNKDFLSYLSDLGLSINSSISIFQELLDSSFPEMEKDTYLIGSFACGKNQESSDLDFVVITAASPTEKQISQFHLYLQMVLNSKVDVFWIHPQDFGKVNDFLFFHLTIFSSLIEQGLFLGEEEIFELPDIQPNVMLERRHWETFLNYTLFIKHGKTEGMAIDLFMYTGQSLSRFTCIYEIFTKQSLKELASYMTFTDLLYLFENHYQKLADHFLANDVIFNLPYFEKDKIIKWNQENFPSLQNIIEVNGSSLRIRRENLRDIL